MDITEFSARYPDEESCIEAFRIQKEKHLVCPDCGGTDFYWLKGKLMHECNNRKCRKRTGLRVGTVMQFSKLPFYVWMYTPCMMVLSPRIPSALSLHRFIQDRCGIKRYQPVWEMCHKMREGMGIHDRQRMPEGKVEVDEAFFTTTHPGHLQEKLLTRGSGSGRNSPVVLMSQSYTPDTVKERDRKYKHARCLGRMRFAVLPNLKKKTVMGKVRDNVRKDSTLYSDASKSHTVFHLLHNHKGEVAPPTKALKALPRVHMCISNARRDIEAILHMTLGRNLQNYLDSWAYKTNRRRLMNSRKWADSLEMMVTTSVGFRSVIYPLYDHFQLKVPA